MIILEEGSHLLVTLDALCQVYFLSTVPFLCFMAYCGVCFTFYAILLRLKARDLFITFKKRKHISVKQKMGSLFILQTMKFLEMVQKTRL